MKTLLAPVVCALTLAGCGGGGSPIGSASSSSSGSGGSTTTATLTYWIPVAITPFGTPNDLVTGIFVIPSTALGASPAYVSYTGQSLNLGYGNGTTLSAGNVVSDYSPATFLYAAVDTNNTVHLYSLDLTSTAVPVPAQVSNLSLPLAAGVTLPQVLCDSHPGFGNILQAATLFVVLHIAGSAGCNTTGDIWEVVHYTDSATTAPVQVSITSSSFTPLYTPSGALGGLLLLDPESHNLYEYADATFTSPVTTIAGGDISSVSSLYASGVTGAQKFAGTTLFLVVTINGSEKLYRISYASTTPALVYTASGTLDSYAVYDDDNLYFDDAVTGSSSTMQTIWQVPLTGAAPLELYSGTNSSPLGLVGANDSVLVVLSQGVLETLAVGGANGTPQPIGSSSQVAAAWMWAATAGMPATDLIFANIAGGDVNNGGPFSSTEIFGVDGSVQQPLTLNSEFLPNATTPQSGMVLERAGIDSLDMGGTIQAIKLSTLASTTVYSVGGSCCGFNLSGLSSGIVAGEISPFAPIEPDALIINLSSGTAVEFGDLTEQGTVF